MIYIRLKYKICQKVPENFLATANDVNIENISRKIMFMEFIEYRKSQIWDHDTINLASPSLGVVLEKVTIILILFISAIKAGQQVKKYFHSKGYFWKKSKNLYLTFVMLGRPNLSRSRYISIFPDSPTYQPTLIFMSGQVS